MVSQTARGTEPSVCPYASALEEFFERLLKIESGRFGVTNAEQMFRASEILFGDAEPVGRIQ